MPPSIAAALMLKNLSSGFAVMLAAAAIIPCRADDAAGRCADRAAIERVYHGHRTGTKTSFEQAMPPALVAQLVRIDERKETVLRRVYGMTLTDAMIDAEVRRIEATTRAPEVLAEIKAALGNDPARFASAMARPIVVERTLRARFENDDKLHAGQRHEAEQARETALASVKDAIAKRIAALSANKAGTVTETTWQLTPRPDDAKSETSAPPPQTRGVAKSGAYSVEATAQVAQALTPPAGGRDPKFYFDDLDPELQKVLRVQLQKPGDVSAVIEIPGGFLLFLAKEISAETLTAASLSIPKRSYEEWLAQQLN